jgi:hypothetical protein
MIDFFKKKNNLSIECVVQVSLSKKNINLFEVFHSGSTRTIRERSLNYAIHISRNLENTVKKLLNLRNGRVFMNYITNTKGNIQVLSFEILISTTKSQDLIHRKLKPIVSQLGALLGELLIKEGYLTSVLYNTHITKVIITQL